MFPTFVLTHLPIGLVGLLIAAIFAAAMSTISAELASLSTATVIDFYRRWWTAGRRRRALLRVSRLATGFWGLFASVVAIYAAELGSLIEVVNRFGSFFYGSILGVFILAIVVSARQRPRRVRRADRRDGRGVAAWPRFTSVEFLWLNVVGAVGGVRRRRRRQRPHRRPAAPPPPDEAAVANRPLLIALGLVALVMVLSWALGEFLRQRKTTKRRPRR